MLDPALLAPERVRGLRRREYEALVELGTFARQRIELLCGALVEMSPQNEPHADIVAWLHERLVLAIDRRRYQVRGHSSFAATGDSVPEPDIQVIARVPRAKLPRTAALLVEVAASSLTKDRLVKAAIYALARVPEYWIVDVRARRVEVHSRPMRTGYAHTRIVRPGGILRPIKLAGVELSVADIPWGGVASPGRAHGDFTSERLAVRHRSG